MSTIEGLEARMERVEHILFSNGQKGLEQVVREFIASMEARDEERENAASRSVEVMKAIDRKWNLRVAIIALALTAFFGLLNLFGPVLRHDFGLPAATNQRTSVGSTTQQNALQ
jgi:hypothetical protein